ncbi:MAG: thymidine phosphorylase [Ruminococcaceae bacterium]|nr:thymidine phosphorylase [Oscillospiraceae bacterium]
MRIYDIIDKKRKGKPLSDEEIRFFVKGYTDGSVADYQAAALAMAVCCNGMDEREVVTLTLAMRDSGDTVDLSRFGNLSADKHSTGGVGDKTSLIIAPIVASQGGRLAKMSGRGLGHTGGTIDKLESIKGFRTTLSPEEFMEQTEKVGLAIIGQSGNLAPADKKLYALRDVTATVESIPLIASSIMSKKLAAGAHSIVLDVKTGSGAFMKTVDDARALARCMVDIGKAAGRNVAAVITDMDTPLGYAIGNALEVREAVGILRGEGCKALREVCYTLSAKLIELCLSVSEEESRERVRDAVESGAALECFRKWVEAQGGDASFVDDLSLLPQAEAKCEVYAPQDGYICSMDAMEIGSACVMLGAGREKKDDEIDYAAGIVLAARTGDRVSKGDLIATLYAKSEDIAKAAMGRFAGAIKFGDEPPEKRPLVYDVVE